MESSILYEALNEKLKKFGITPIATQGPAVPATEEDLKKDAEGVTYPNLHRRYITPGASVGVSTNYSFRHATIDTSEEREENEIP